MNIVSLLLVGCIGWLVLAMRPATGPDEASLAPRAMSPCTMDVDGYVRGEIYGAIKQQLDWRGATMACDGMPKPDEGIRVAFREFADPDQPGLTIVIAIDGVTPGQTFVEQGANVTINDRRNGRFFSTQGEQRCWVTMRELVKLIGTSGDVWRLNGLLYCTAALPAAAGAGSITLGEIEFSGQVFASAD